MMSAPHESSEHRVRSRNLAQHLALHVLTDREWSRGRDILAVSSAALDGGATAIQLRDKTASTRTLVEVGRALRVLTREHGSLLIVNDRIDVALAVDADGAHVGQDDMPAHIARQLLGPDRILGISAGSLEEASRAVAAHADYVSIGPIHPTRAKADAGPPTGTQLITEVAARYSTPLMAIGGITPENVGEIIRAGAVGVAVISTVVNAEDITAAAHRLSTVIQNTLTDDRGI